MSARCVPRALAERLGPDGTEAFSELLETTRTEWSEDVLALATARFERSLTSELSRLRVEVGAELSRMRVDVATECGKLRTDVFGELVHVRREVSDLREDLAAVRVDLFKWSFVFWVGQVAAVAGLLAFMLRSVS